MYGDGRANSSPPPSPRTDLSHGGASSKSSEVCLQPQAPLWLCCRRHQHCFVSLFSNRMFSSRRWQRHQTPCASPRRCGLRSTFILGHEFDSRPTETKRDGYAAGAVDPSSTSPLITRNTTRNRKRPARPHEDPDNRQTTTVSNVTRE